MYRQVHPTTSEQPKSFGPQDAPNLHEHPLGRPVTKRLVYNHGSPFHRPARRSRRANLWV